MGIVDNIKDTVALIQKMDNLDLYRKVLDMQAEVMALVEENADLKRKLRVSDELVFRDNAYWRGQGSQRENGPFCPRCWDSEAKLIRLKITKAYQPECPNCKTYFPPESYTLTLV